MTEVGKRTLVWWAGAVFIMIIASWMSFWLFLGIVLLYNILTARIGYYCLPSFYNKDEDKDS